MEENITNTAILIIEDSPTFQLKIKSILERNGFTHLYFARDGKEGLGIISGSKQIDFCIVDLEMPVMNGFQFLEKLYSSPEYAPWSKIPSIVLSSVEKKEGIIRALELGAADYLYKKYSDKELLVRVGAQLRLIHLVGEREALQQEVSLKNEREKLENMKANFIDTLTHELKTPLTNIFGIASLLRNSLGNRLNEEEKELFSDLENESDTLNGIISKLIEINQLKHGGFGEVSLSQISLSELMREIIPSLEREIGEKHIDLMTEFSEDATYVKGNRDLLLKVLLEGGKNAIKFIKRRGTVRFTSCRDNDKIIVQIADNGIGIEDAKKPLVFNLFYQVDDSSTRKFGGAGTGLYLCKMLLENMGERIWFTDNDPKGAILNISQPSV